MPHSAPPITLMLVDDHAVVRAGYKRYLELDQRLSVVEEASTGEEAYERLRAREVDVVVMDLSMPGQGGFESLRRILSRFPKQKVLIFSMHENVSIARQALQLGASGYLTKSMQPDEIVAAIHAVIAGQQPVAPSLDFDSPLEATNAALADLLPREFEVLTLLAQGHNVDEIAARLHISERTASNYATTVRKKLGVSSIYELRKYAEKHGLLAEPPSIGPSTP
ncbi:MAG: Response regulator containing a CheY-like receiver domain and an DNA-binding domain [Pseudomonadota bacterium]